MHALQYPVMRLLPPVALVVTICDLLRLKHFLQQVGEKEAAEAARYSDKGMKDTKKDAILEHLGVTDDGPLTLKQRAQKWFLS